MTTSTERPAEVGPGTADSKQPAVTRIDSDCHPYMFEADLMPYVSERWRRYVDRIGLRQQAAFGLTIGAHPLAARTDAWGPNGELPGTDPAFFASQLMDQHGIDIAILNSQVMQSQAFMGPGIPRELVTELMRATNRQESEVWLDADARYRGAICLPFENPEACVEEIERCAADRRFVQILLPFRTLDPFGSQKYWPIFEAAVAHDLPISLHPAAQHVITGSGWQSFYYEHHTALPTVLLPQMASLVFEGTFDRFPTLQILFQEGGWSWVPAFLWRLDHTYGLLREEIPSLQRRPSDYVRDHFWFTTQPMEEPDRPDQFTEMHQQWEEAGLGSRLMFSSDYPHWDFDAPDIAVPRSLSDDARRRLFLTNAATCYRRLDLTPEGLSR
ncbi:amidohydrolase family protein [Pseudonocardia sp. RS010]|uniref:amidohydrolase family protein n=1 Tax=Pseudonocardia sp. RS010 TaxID=3385979 RepID=UPI00399EED5D